MKRMIHDIEEIILEQHSNGGFVSIEAAKLTKHVDEVFAEEALIAMEATNDYPPGFRNMTLIALIKSDLGGKNRMGWEKHKTALKDEGFI